MKKLTLMALLALTISSCSYENYNHWKGRTRRGNPRILATGDTVRVGTLFGQNLFEIIEPSDRGCYAAWDLKTRMYAVIAGSNLEKVSK